MTLCTGCAYPRSREFVACKDCFLTTDKAAYVAPQMHGDGALVHTRYHFRLVSRFENRSKQPIYLHRCFRNSEQPLFSVVNVDSASVGDWKNEPAYAQPWACVGHDRQFEILPGEVRIDTLEVEGPNSFNGRTGEPHGRVEGTFRLYFEAHTGRDERSQWIPYRNRVSNPFTVRVSR